MQAFEIVTENGKITRIYDNRYSKKVDITNGKHEFGSVSYTLRTEDVNTLPKDAGAPHGDHICALTVTDVTDDTIVMCDKEYGVTTTINNKDYGIEIAWEYKNNAFSKFAAKLPLNYMSQKNGEWTHQLLVSSPYFNKDTGVLTCMFTSPDKNNLLLVVKTPVEAFRIEYSPEAYYHYFTGFEIFDNLDRVYGNTPKDKGRIEAVLLPISTYTEAIQKTTEILGLPAATYLKSSAFVGDRFSVKIIGKCDEIRVVSPNGENEILDAADEITVIAKQYGFYKIIPYINGKQGIECTCFAHKSWVDMYRDAVEAVPVHRDKVIGKTLDGVDVFMPPHVQLGNVSDSNLCEHTMWAWAQLRYMRHFEVSANARENIENVIRIILPDNESCYRPRQTIIPVVQKLVEEAAAYNTYKDDRIQEAFNGANILIDFWRVYKNNEFLETAISIVESLIAYYMNEEGVIVRGRHGDYTTVTALILPVVDLYVVLKQIGDKRAEKFKGFAIKIADAMVKRGFNFPTENDETDNFNEEYEDGSISCTALTVLYVARHVQYKKEYIAFAEKIMQLHDAYCVRTYTAPMFNSSLRWWENLWEGDTDGPALCCGHAWSIQRGEALFWLGVESKNPNRFLDSYNTFMSNFSKQDRDGNMYAIYQCEPCISGAEYEAKDISRRFAVGFPKTKDGTLSRYVYARAYDTWFKCSTVLKDGTMLNAMQEDGKIISLAPFFSMLYTDKKGELVVRTDSEIEIISPYEIDVKNGEIVGKTEVGIIIKPLNNEIKIEVK